MMTDTTRPRSDATVELDMSGRQLGDYRLLRRLGRGAMAEVYLAEQLSLRRQVAFKVLKRELAGDDSYVRRFHLEAQSAAALIHANIVQIYEVGCVDGIHFIAQEYVPGQNLAQRLAQRGPLEVPRALTVIRQVAAALAKAAQCGIIHRDIKPENIILAPTGEVKVADFGLARIAGQTEGMNLTQVGITMGTPLYMSPEQVEGRPLDPRTDLYSLGVTCFHMLAGRPPFHGDTALSVAVQHLKSPPPRLESLRPDLPPALCRIVHRMLAKSLAERYESARELLRDLRAVTVDGADAAADGDGTDEWMSAELADDADLRLAATARLDAVMKTQTLPRRRRAGWMALLAALVAAFALGALAAWQTREPFLLAAAGPVVERKGSAESQYINAQFAGTEAAWNAVLEYFPDDKKYVPLAKQQLARLYLQNGDDDRALRLFEEFAAADDVEKQHRAFGLAGQLVVHSARRQHDESGKRLADLADLVGGLDLEQGNFDADKLEKLLDGLRPLLDAQMLRMVAYAIRGTLQASDRETAARLQSWIDAQFPDEPVPGADGP